MAETCLESVVLNTGKRVLAKRTPYGLSAVTYANRTQAVARASWLQQQGIDCFVSAGHPKYIVLPDVDHV